MILELGALDVSQVRGRSLGCSIVDQVTTGVDPNGIAGIDCPTFVSGMVALDDGTFTGKAGQFLQEDEPAIKPGIREGERGGAAKLSSGSGKTTSQQAEAGELKPLNSSISMTRGLLPSEAFLTLPGLKCATWISGRGSRNLVWDKVPHSTACLQTHLAVLLLNNPPVMATTVGVGPPVVVPHPTNAPPISSAWLSVNVPPVIVHLALPRPLKSPEQYICSGRVGHFRDLEREQADG